MFRFQNHWTLATSTMRHHEAQAHGHCSKTSLLLSRFVKVDYTVWMPSPVVYSIQPILSLKIKTEQTSTTYTLNYICVHILCSCRYLTQALLHFFSEFAAALQSTQIQPSTMQTTLWNKWITAPLCCTPIHLNIVFFVKQRPSYHCDTRYRAGRNVFSR